MKLYTKMGPKLDQKVSYLSQIDFNNRTRIWN